MAKYIQLNIENRIAYITLNRPEKRNALNSELIAELSTCFKELQSDACVKVVVLKAAGTVFCAGADLEYLRQLQSGSSRENLEDSKKLKDLFLSIYSFEKPLLAQVEGNAVAGGCGLISVCDIVFSVPEAHFGYPEVKIGFVPALVSTFLLKKTGEGPAKRLLITGELINARTACNFGLVNFVVSPDKIEQAVKEYAMNLVLKTSSEAVKLTKKLVSDISGLPVADALEIAEKVNAEARLTEDCKKGIAAFLNKESLQW